MYVHCGPSMMSQKKTLLEIHWEVLQLLTGFPLIIPKPQGGRSMLLLLSAKTASLAVHPLECLSNGSFPLTSLTILNRWHFNLLWPTFPEFLLLCSIINYDFPSLFFIFYSQKVSYVHDGSESTQDAVIFEIELSSSRPNSLDKEMRVR